MLHTHLIAQEGDLSVPLVELKVSLWENCHALVPSKVKSIIIIIAS